MGRIVHGLGEVIEQVETLVADTLILSDWFPSNAMMATIITQYSTTSSAVTTIALAMKSYCLRLRTENAALQFGQEEKRWSGNQGLTPILP